MENFFDGESLGLKSGGVTLSSRVACIGVEGLSEESEEAMMLTITSRCCSSTAQTRGQEASLGAVNTDQGRGQHLIQQLNAHACTHPVVERYNIDRFFDRAICSSSKQKAQGCVLQCLVVHIAAEQRHIDASIEFA